MSVVEISDVILKGNDMPSTEKRKSEYKQTECDNCGGTGYFKVDGFSRQRCDCVETKPQTTAYHAIHRCCIA